MPGWGLIITLDNNSGIVGPGLSSLADEGRKLTPLPQWTLKINKSMSEHHTTARHAISLWLGRARRNW